MRASASSVLACWLCVSLSATAGQHTPEQPADHPLRVTTDTVEYCDKLLERITQIGDGMATMPARVETLTAEGRRMCADGYVRRGILRLRRALVILQAAR